MRFLITGCKGQLGTELQRTFASSGFDHHEVFGVDRPEIDLERRDVAVAAVCEAEPDVIIHCAAFTAVDACEADPDAAFAANELATRWVADGARRVGAHMVYLSTDYVFDGTLATPYRESDTPNPQSVYGKSKLAGERQLDPAWTIARTSWVCGEFGNNIVKTVLQLAAKQTPLKFVTDQIGCPTLTTDLAPALIRLGIERAPGIFHVTNNGAVSWYQFVQRILRAGGFDESLVEPILTAEMQPARPAPRPANSVLSNAALCAIGIGPLRDFTEPLAAAVTAILQS